jgi:outer membrane immunogenic protein
MTPFYFCKPLAKAFCAAFAVSFVTLVASAGEIPAPPKPFDWSGFYIGANVGAAWSSYDFNGYHTTVDVGQQLRLFEGPLMMGKNTDAPQPDAIIVGNGSELLFDSSGHSGGDSDVSVTGGGQVGYQMQFGHFVVGLEGGFNGISTSDVINSKGFGTVNFNTDAALGPDGFFPFITEGDTKLHSMRTAQTHWNGSLAGKLGYAMGPWLFYGTGGVDFAGVTVIAQDSAHTDFFGFQPGGADGRINFVGSIANHFKAEDDQVLVGYTAGGGVEYAVTQACSMGIEYRHNGLGSKDFHFASNQGPVFPGNTGVGTDSDQITFRVNFWLGHLNH